jgi:hypothetical protein
VSLARIFHGIEIRRGSDAGGRWRGVPSTG